MVKPQAILPGYYVAIGLEPGTAPSRCFIGLLMAADEYGVRINLVHWDDSLDMIMRDTEDLFVPWVSITSMLVCNKEEPVRRFLRDKAPAWQKKMNSLDNPSS